MTPVGFLSAVLVPLGWMFVSAAAEEAVAATNVQHDAAATAGGPAVPRPAATNSSGGNSTNSRGGMLDGLGADSSMIQRALYVLIGITAIGVLYFLIRAVRLKRPTHKKKYGLLSNYDDSVEMEAVESDEDDTLYEARGLRRSEVNTQQQSHRLTWHLFTAIYVQNPIIKHINNNKHPS
uniref:Uncharacterized protein n=1 Tax=Gasterosteus aculeatus aculeatus TaxID=481459 RepID=A0AAQ4P278_GASAC